MVISNFNINTLTAAKEVFIPMAMELLALRGLDMLSQTIGKIRAITNPELQYLGLLPTKYEPVPKFKLGLIMPFGKLRTNGFLPFMVSLLNHQSLKHPDWDGFINVI
jgi:hypothetical protein